MTLLMLLAALQAPGPQVKMSLDHNHVALGDELTVSVIASSRSLEPMQVYVPTLTGFELVGRSERTEVSQFGGPSRTTTLELRLRALKSGRWTIGPVRASQAGTGAVAGSVAVQVDEHAVAQQMAVNPMLRRLLTRASPPTKPGDPGVSLVLSARSAMVGEQVDVLTAAWFPRDLRARLRRPPTLQPPVIEGVWSYPQPVPPGIVATRTVGRTLYDLFVTHQVIFPLVSGRIDVEPAELKYSVPLAMQFFSQEQRYSLQSRAETLTVAPTPTANRPAGYAGAVGQAIRLDRTVEPVTAHAGEPITVAVTISGDGNPALWPVPDLRWPAGARPYPDRNDEHVAVNGGRLGGSKTFRFTVIPDSAGTLALPGITYSYFDTGTRGFRTATLAGTSLAVAPGNETKISRPLPPPLLADDGPPLAWRAANAVPVWAWTLLFALPPLGWLARRFRLRRPAPAATSIGADLRGVEAELESLIQRLVPRAETLPEASQLAALRSAGVAAGDAEQLVALRERFRALRYGPGGGPIPADLARAARELIGRLAPAARRSGAAWTSRVGAVVIILAAVGAARAEQGPLPEQLYRRGALHGAVQGFADRTAASPASPANWYNLGAAYFRLGADGRAAGAWQQAYRLAPRERSVRRALELVPPPEGVSAERLWMPPVTWEELALLAVPVWFAGWMLFARGRNRRRRELALALLALGAGLGVGALALRWRTAQPLAVAVAKISLQLSPHERAPAVAPLDPGTALRVVRRAPGWVMVDAPGGRLGWVEAESVFLLRDL